VLAVSPVVFENPPKLFAERYAVGVPDPAPLNLELEKFAVDPLKEKLKPVLDVSWRELTLIAKSVNVPGMLVN